jgi:hypothetical protein
MLGLDFRTGKLAVFLTALALGMLAPARIAFAQG